MSKICERTRQNDGNCQKNNAQFYEHNGSIPVLIYVPIPVIADSIEIVIGKSCNQQHRVHWVANRQLNNFVITEF